MLKLLLQLLLLLLNLLDLLESRTYVWIVQPLYLLKLIIV